MIEKKMPANNIGSRLKALRGRKNIMQQELADIMGVSRVTVGSYEKGDVVPQTGALIKVAQTYGVSMDWLCGVRTHITSYGDAFMSIFDICERTDCDISATDNILNEVLEEFKKMRKLRDKKYITDRTMELWLKDKFQELSNIPLSQEVSI